MAELNKIKFSHKDVVAALLKQKEIYEGIWRLTIDFGLGAANVGPDKSSVNPTAMVPILGIGLMECKEISNIAVDAATLRKESSSKTKGKAVKNAPSKKNPIKKIPTV